MPPGLERLRTITRDTPVILLTDLEPLVTIARSLFASVQHCSFARLMTSAVAVSHQHLLWIDPPAGKQLQATKLDKLCDALLQVVTGPSQQDIPVLAMKPMIKYDTPHHRWAKFLRTWRPHTTTHCICQYFTRESSRVVNHYKLRVYTTSIPCHNRDCNHAADMTINARDGRRIRQFMRQWVSHWLFSGLTHEPSEVVSRRPSTSTKLPKSSIQGGVLIDESEDNILTDEALSRGAQNPPDSAGKLTSDNEHRDPLVNVPVKEIAFPTASKERQQAQRRKEKAEGKVRVVNKRKQQVEDHHDDCGEDLSSLGSETALWSEPIWANDLLNEINDHEIIDDDDPICDNLALFMHWGRSPYKPSYNINVVYPRNLNDLVSQLSHQRPGVDIADLSGETLRSNQLAVRRRSSDGNTTNLVTDCNFAEETDRDALKQYLSYNNVLLLTLPPANGINSSVYYGELVNIQLHHGHHFLQEQHYPTRLFDAPPWSTLLGTQGVERIAYFRCHPELTGNEAQHQRSISTITASHKALVWPFSRLPQCPCTHTAGEAPLGNTSNLRTAWSHVEAMFVADGLSMLRSCVGRAPLSKTYITAYPKIDKTKVARAQPGGIPGQRADERAPPKRESNCPACKNQWSRHDWEHTRTIGECSYPYDEPFIPECQACSARLGRDNCKHTYKPGCQWDVNRERAYEPRTGRHPRDPAHKASESSTSRMPGTTGGVELGADAEEAVDTTLQQASSARPRKPTSLDVGGGHEEPVGDPLVDESDPQASSSSSSARPGRGPDIEQRERTSLRERVFGPENPPDWVHFDIQRVLRTLRLGTKAQCELTLRKLHLRWWHASIAAMTRLLERAGVPAQIIKYIPAIVQSCIACRTWAKPKPHSIASLEISDTFNHAIECDMMFVYKRIVFHVIDRCTRWYWSRETTSKDEAHMIWCVDEWIRTHGPPKIIYTDQETSMVVSDKFQSYLKRWGVDHRPRAKGQHLGHIDRRGALVRDVIHKIVSQLHEDGLEMPFEYVLSEATFCTNALLSINGCTPYNAVYGRTPTLLPSINALDDWTADARHSDSPGTIRHTHRMREIAIQSIMQETAKVRISRALSTPTLEAGEREQYKAGDQVDYHHKDIKDRSGWIGPATVVDATHIQRGTVTVKHLTRPIEIKLGSLRRHSEFLVFLATLCSAYHNQTHAWQFIRNFIERMDTGRVLVLGTVPTSKKTQAHLSKSLVWQSVGAQHMALFRTIVHFALSGLWCDDVIAAKCAQGVATLPAMPEYSGSLALWWYPGSSNINRITSDHGVPQINFQRLDTQTWTNIRVLQLLRASKDPLVNESSTTTPDNPDEWEQPSIHTPHDSLAPISEEPSELSDDDQNFFQHDDDELFDALTEASFCCTEYSSDLGLEYCSDTDISTHLSDDNDHFSYLSQDYEDDVEYNNSYHIVAGNVRAGLPPDHQLDEEYDCVELYYEGDAWKLANQGKDPLVIPGAGETLCVQMYLGGKKQVVVQRDDSNLSNDDVKKHWPEVAAAIQKELETWVAHNCISRKPRRDARNVIDVRWVHKWKWDTVVRSANDSTEGAATKRLVIRSRLCLRGFKDMQAQELASYAGTSQRYSQRILVSEAVIRRWPIATTDISKAFLQGVTYKELAEATGEPLREVNFVLPAYCIPYLRKCKGFENFDPNTECLHCDKPGTGCNDAPRCFSIKLAKVTQDACGMQKCTVDNELCFLHDNNGAEVPLDNSNPDSSAEDPLVHGAAVLSKRKWKRLLALMAKHVDDLKITGTKAIILWILQQIEKVFGPLKIEWHNFTNCGVRHIQDPSTFEVTLDQAEYIKGIKTIIHTELQTSASTDKCSEAVHALYWSILGAIAFAVLTRPDLAVFVSALQRHSNSPCVIHAKRLNMVVRWAQRNPRKLRYCALDKIARPEGSTIPTHLRQYGDAAFKKEEASGHSMRGALYIRTGGHTTQHMTTTQCGHLLDYVARSQRRVVRATFTAELLNGCDTQDKGFLLAQMLHEITTGIVSCAYSRHLRENGGYAIPMVLYLDALSVYAAVTATFVKTPADNGVLCHLQYLRELLDHNVLHALAWTDTRDMLADGMTKGAVERDAIHDVMDGNVKVVQAMKLWRPKHLLARSQ